jgi:hypothetical protein
VASAIGPLDPAVYAGVGIGVAHREVEICPRNVPKVRLCGEQCIDNRTKGMVIQARNISIRDQT